MVPRRVVTEVRKNKLDICFLVIMAVVVQRFLHCTLCLVCTDVLWEHTASVFRVTELGPSPT